MRYSNENSNPSCPIDGFGVAVKDMSYVWRLEVFTFPNQNVWAVVLANYRLWCFGIPYPKGYISEVSDMTIKFVMLNTL